jgi:hypothetical protein
MEQSWTFDRYDVPSGDLEFWAIRRGKFARIEAQGRRKQILMRTGVAVLAAVAVGVALV